MNITALLMDNIKFLKQFFLRNANRIVSGYATGNNTNVSVVEYRLMCRYVTLFLIYSTHMMVILCAEDRSSYSDQSNEQ